MTPEEAEKQDMSITVTTGRPWWLAPWGCSYNFQEKYQRLEIKILHWEILIRFYTPISKTGEGS